MVTLKDYSVNMFLRQYWSDPRLAFRQLGYQESLTLNSMKVSTDIVKTKAFSCLKYNLSVRHLVAFTSCGWLLIHDHSFWRRIRDDKYLWEIDWKQKEVLFVVADAAGIEKRSVLVHFPHKKIPPPTYQFHTEIERLFICVTIIDYAKQYRVIYT